jgi:polysaccharide export outer membrane protein
MLNRFVSLRVSLCALAFLAVSVASSAATPSAAPAPGGAPTEAYTVKPGDVLSIAVWKEPDLQGPVLVRPDGSFSFPLAGQIDARGRTVAELQQTVTERLRKFISDPVVTVSVSEVKGNKVYVIGQVNKPGEFIVNPRVDVMQALSMAGGTTAFASLGEIVILRRSESGQQALPFRYADVARGRNLQQNIMLQAGDVVVVP